MDAGLLSFLVFSVAVRMLSDTVTSLTSHTVFTLNDDEYRSPWLARRVG